METTILDPQCDKESEQTSSLPRADRHKRDELEFSPKFPRVVSKLSGKWGGVPVHVGELWTAKQRAARALHEVSYRACFKPQLPRFFIERFSKRGSWIYDPFSGRGTTAIEAALLGRNVVANDVNPLSRILTEPRLSPPLISDVEERLQTIFYRAKARCNFDLSMFYHARTESEIVSLRDYLNLRKSTGEEDTLDRWIRMVATNRLTGHSPGFFSVYTFPPNQAVSRDSQKRINRVRQQKPEYRDTKKLILRKTWSLLHSLTQVDKENLASAEARFHTQDARHVHEIPADSIQLTVTSPPFLDVVHYAEDNWLRSWFNAVETDKVAARITMARTVAEWTAVMRDVFCELHRVTAYGGWVAFEVGEVRNGSIKLEESLVPLGVSAGFRCQGILINSQRFTKTAHIWGVSNNDRGTNSNRIVLFYKSTG